MEERCLEGDCHETNHGCTIAVSAPGLTGAGRAGSGITELRAYHSVSPCRDPVTQQLLTCLVYRGMFAGEVHTYRVFARGHNLEPVRIQFNRGFDQPENIWVRHGFDTY
jgi:hypothetical protein